MQTSYSKNYSPTVDLTPAKSRDSQWDKKYIIENLPPWVYQDNPEPETINECAATICRLEHTIEDIDLQIKIREFELETGTGRQQSKHEHDKWVVQALKAKQTHKYLLSAYKYWKLINDKNLSGTSNIKISAKIGEFLYTLCDLLKDDSPIFEEEIETLRQEVKAFLNFIYVK